MNLIVAFYRYGSEKGLKNSGLNRDSNPDLCDADAMPCQLKYQYQSNWELVVMSVDYTPLDVQIDDVHTRFFLVLTWTMSIDNESTLSRRV